MADGIEHAPYLLVATFVEHYLEPCIRFALIRLFNLRRGCANTVFERDAATQTLNRFLSSGIVSSVYRDYPAVAKMAEQMSKRQTPLEPFDSADPNRKMTLEETPWLRQAR